jgi:hypothetical protein
MIYSQHSLYVVLGAKCPSIPAWIEIGQKKDVYSKNEREEEDIISKQLIHLM